MHNNHFFGGGYSRRVAFSATEDSGAAISCVAEFYDANSMELSEPKRVCVPRFVNEQPVNPSDQLAGDLHRNEPALQIQSDDAAAVFFRNPNQPLKA